MASTRKRPHSSAPSANVKQGYARYLKRALALPQTEESTSYGTPAVKVRGKLLSRWRTEAEGALAIHCDMLDREILLETQPEVFFVTEHYAGYPMVLMHLDRASSAQLDDILERAWERVAPASVKKLRHAKPPPSIQPQRRRLRR